jgi:glucosylceramidase
VRVWISTADHRDQLARKPDLRLHGAAAFAPTIEIDPEQRFQKIVGFGAAITDASAILIQTRLTAAQRAALLQDLFGRAPGLRIGLVRVPIGASDFSATHYSFDDVPIGENDIALTHFSIEPIEQTILPVLRDALALNPNLRVIASPWTAPGWMKTSDSLLHGTLAPEFFGAFTDYLVKYVEEMKARGVPIYALTLQNEPHFDPLNYPGMLLNAANRAQLIGKFLGPALAQRHAAPLILDWDHNWDRPQEPLEVLDDPIAAPYVAGIAWHCYAGKVGAQTQVHLRHPDKDAYLTECSSGNWVTKTEPSLLSMTRGQIIASTRDWARGVLFWNLALDESSGPHLGGCHSCLGLITIDSRTGNVTRNDDYYAIGHASRFVNIGAERIESTATDGGLSNVAFRDPQDGVIVLLAANSSKQPRTISVKCRLRAFEYTMPAQSVATFVWSGAGATR